MSYAESLSTGLMLTPFSTKRTVMQINNRSRSKIKDKFLWVTRGSKSLSYYCSEKNGPNDVGFILENSARSRIRN